jgi:hypothetical protein
MARCPHCGEENPSGARFCGECGRDLTAPAPKETGKASGGGMRRWLLACAGLAIAGLCGLCLLVVLVPGLFGALDLSGLLDNQELPGLVQPVSSIAPATEQPVIYNVWLEHNVPYEGENFLVVNLEFEVEQAVVREVTVVALVWRQNGAPLAGIDADYTVDGQVGLIDLGEVEYSPSTYWEDYKFWFPASALPVGQGHYLTVSIADSVSGAVLDSWRTESFDVEG